MFDEEEEEEAAAAQPGAQVPTPPRRNVERPPVSPSCPAMHALTREQERDLGNPPALPALDQGAVRELSRGRRSSRPWISRGSTASAARMQCALRPPAPPAPLPCQGSGVHGPHEGWRLQ
jgi:hypothetical protein